MESTRCGEGGWRGRQRESCRLESTGVCGDEGSHNPWVAGSSPARPTRKTRRSQAHCASLVRSQRSSRAMDHAMAACYGLAMAGRSQPRRRQRGSIRSLPSGSLQVRVFAGTDPVSKKDLYLTQVVPPGPRQAREAEQARTRLLNQVDEKRNPKTRATVDQLIAKYFEVADIDTQTMRGYKSKYENHIKPLIGSQQLARLDIEILDSFYSQLR